MKKCLYMAMMALVAILPFSLTSCSSDDDDNGGNITSGKKLLQITCSGYDTRTFLYGGDGKLVRASIGDHYIKISWNGNNITTTENFGDPPSTTVLKDNKIISSTGYGKTTITTYTGNNVKTTDDDKTYTWKDGNITKVVDTDGYDGETLTLTCTYYTDKVNKHPIVDFDALLLYDAIQAEYSSELLMAHPNLLGATNKNLLKSVTSSDGESISFTYELDNEGYPTKITEITKRTSGDSETRTYNLSWE